MAIKYTVAVNHGEFMDGIYNEYSDAEEAVIEYLLEDGAEPRMVSDAVEDGDLSDLGDGYGYNIKEIIVREEKK